MPTVVLGLAITPQCVFGCPCLSRYVCRITSMSHGRFNLTEFRVNFSCLTWMVFVVAFAFSADSFGSQCRVCSLVKP